MAPDPDDDPGSGNGDEENGKGNEDEEPEGEPEPKLSPSGDSTLKTCSLCCQKQIHCYPQPLDVGNGLGDHQNQVPEHFASGKMVLAVRSPQVP